MNLVGSGVVVPQLARVRKRYQHDTFYPTFLPVIPCPELDSPKDGSVNANGDTPGSKATYKCDNGFKLVGQSLRTCELGGEWNGSPPTCMGKKQRQ